MGMKMKKNPSRLQLSIAKSAFAAIVYFLIIMIPVDLLLSHYIFKSPPNIAGSVLACIILGYFLHGQLASKYKCQQPPNEKA